MEVKLGYSYKALINLKASSSRRSATHNTLNYDIHIKESADAEDGQGQGYRGLLTSEVVFFIFIRNTHTETV